MMKLKQICIVIIGILLLLSVAGGFFRLSGTNVAMIGTGFESFLSDENYIPNNCQHQADIWLGVYKNQLLLYRQCEYSSKKTAYDGWLCALTDGQIEKITKLGNETDVHMIGLYQQFLYYWVYGEEENDSLLCYDLDAREERLLFSGNACSARTTHIDASGAFFIPLEMDDRNAPQQFVRVLDGQVLSVSTEKVYNQIGDLRYRNTILHPEYTERVVVIDEHQSEEEITLGIAKSRTVMSSPYGAIVHNEGYSQLLYLIQSAESVECLFEVPCMSSESAVTVVDEYVFISLKRFEGYQDIGLRRYENDEVEGTYMINLTDYSSVKINDGIYSGLYYFGGEYLFATDEYGCVYLIGFDGEIKESVFLVE